MCSTHSSMHRNTRSDGRTCSLFHTVRNTYSAIYARRKSPPWDAGHSHRSRQSHHTSVLTVSLEQQAAHQYNLVVVHVTTTSTTSEKLQMTLSITGVPSYCCRSSRRCSRILSLLLRVRIIHAGSTRRACLLCTYPPYKTQITACSSSTRFTSPTTRARIFPSFEPVPRPPEGGRWPRWGELERTV